MKLGRNLKQPKVGEHYFIASNEYQRTKIKFEQIPSFDLVQIL